jgi:hypothetical protein
MTKFLKTVAEAPEKVAEALEATVFFTSIKSEKIFARAWENLVK